MMYPTNPAIIDHLAPVADSFLLTTLPIADTPQLAAIIVDAKYVIIRTFPIPVYANKSDTVPISSIITRLINNCCFSLLNSTNTISDVMENPITDKNVDAEDKPAAIIPASITVPTILGMT